MRLSERWYAAPSATALLAPLAQVYGAALRLRRLAYARGWLAVHRAARPVIVVGNLTVGGTGKTPLTLYLAETLRAQGLRPGILSRGYGSRGGGVREVHPGADWREVGDEPLLLARRSGCPTVVAAARAAGARWLTERGVQVILCDDGLQHLALARQAEIVVIDGTRGFGNGRLLPQGPLREPLTRLARAPLLVVNGPAQHPSLAALAAAGRLMRMDLIAEEARGVSGSGAARPLGSFRGSAVHAVAGIGNPARFFAQLRALGLTLIEHPFPDHHAFSRADLDFGDARAVLMTEKDAVKCTAFADARLWYVPVSARFSGPDRRRLLDGLRGALGAARDGSGSH